MKKNLSRLIACACIVLAASCKKDGQIASSIQSFWDCNAAQHFDNASLSSKLTGSWLWVEARGDNSSSKANKKVVLTLTQAGTFSVEENSAITAQGNWSLHIEDSGIMGLVTDVPSRYAYGRILLCDNQLMFNCSYRDGLDNLFIRIK